VRPGDKSKPGLTERAATALLRCCAHKIEDKTRRCGRCNAKPPAMPFLAGFMGPMVEGRFVSATGKRAA